MFNDDQRDHMRYLASLPPEAKCACGWSKFGECFGPCYGDEAKGGHRQCVCPVCKQTVPLWEHTGTPVVGRHEPPGYYGGYCEDCSGSGQPVT